MRAAPGLRRRARSADDEAGAVFNAGARAEPRDGLCCGTRSSSPIMLINFFFTLRAAKLKVSVKEYLTLLEAIKAGVIDDEAGPTVDKFYYLARTALVKDEANFDKFDRAFAAYFKGV